MGFGDLGLVLIEGLARSHEEVISLNVGYVSSGGGCCGCSGGGLVLALWFLLSLISCCLILGFSGSCFILCLFFFLVFFNLLSIIYLGGGSGSCGSCLVFGLAWNLNWGFCSELGCGNGGLDLFLTVFDLSIIGGIGRAL